MTEYTWDKKTGKVKAKGTGKKPITTRYMKGDIPGTIPWGVKKIKKAVTKKKPKQPKKVWT